MDCVEMLVSALVSWRAHTLSTITLPDLVANSSIRSLGLRLLGLWLLLHAFVDLFNLSFQYQGLVLTVLALVTGVLLIVGS